MLMNEATTLLLAKLDRACQDERSMDVHAAFKQMTMQVVGTTAFGCEARQWPPRRLRWAKPQEGEAGMPAGSTSPWYPWALRMLSWQRSRTSRPPPMSCLTCKQVSHPAPCPAQQLLLLSPPSLYPPRSACTGFESSVYMPLLFCFPFLAPLLRPLAALFPDLRLRRLRSARQVIMDSAFRLIKRQRLYMASQVTRPRIQGTSTT